MPFEIDQNGQKIQVYTKAELDDAVDKGKTGLLTQADAKAQADTAAAAARREVKGQLDALNAELTDAKNTAATADSIKARMQETAMSLDLTQKQFNGYKALVAKGLQPKQAEFIIAHPEFASVDYGKAEAVDQAVTRAQEILGAPAPRGNGANGSPTPNKGADVGVGTAANNIIMSQL